MAALHLKSSEIIRDIDPSGAYQLAYDGARKAIQALLMAFGLRITAAGGHYAFVKIAESGISANPGWLHFRVMRQQRNTIEYPEGSHQPLAPEAQVEAYAAAFEIIKDVEKLLNR
ncbi:MAG: hypothetical protein KGL72_05000 [Actinomycetales bacterium]|nr:hypothetical protein [Actinomycetales bacterium]